MWDNAMLERYSRQILVQEIDFAGTERLIQGDLLVGGQGPGPDWLARYAGGAGMRVRRQKAVALEILGEPWTIRCRADGAYWLEIGTGPPDWPHDPPKALTLASRIAIHIIRRVGANRAEKVTAWRLL